MSQSMTMAIAIDRLYAVFKPLSYRKRNHRRYAAICFVIALLSGGVILVMSVAGVDFSKKPSRCGWTSGGVQQTSIDIFVISNALIGPIVAAIYAAVVYKERKWHVHAVGVRGDASTTSFLAAQAKMTATLTRLVVIYCILVAIPLTTFEFWRLLNVFSDFTGNVLSPLRNVLMSLNSAINVVVYARSSSSLRPFLLNLLTCERGVNGGDLDRGHDGVTQTRHSIATVRITR
uniref:G-protein coupled receptors family 1 profile domain-containing protein n=1 Tax=Plectus sambesii TaxID=2011161 RepID=A0A914W874_9BILA